MVPRALIFLHPATWPTGTAPTGTRPTAACRPPTADRRPPTAACRPPTADRLTARWRQLS